MNSAKESLKKFNRDIVIAFISIIVIIVAFFSLIVGVKVSDTVSTSASGLMAANSRQLQININNYITKVEKTATLMFSDESYYLYDATDDSVDEYDKIQCEKKIMDRIVDLGLIDNYSDFGIVYPNDHTVGWISNTTGERYNGRLYRTFSSYIPDSVSDDAWVCGKEGNFDRMYYVKRLNPNAILIVSFYNNELNYVFDYPEEMEGMSVYLTDEDNQVLYSSYRDAIGERLPDEIIQALGDGGSVSVKNSMYLINSHICGNGWKIVCVVPTEIILSEIHGLNKFIFIFAVAVCVVSVVVALLLLRRITKPMDGEVSRLRKNATHDLLSGVLNKTAFTETVTGKAESVQNGAVNVFCMCDIDNFKSINDTFGHAKGDELIRTFGSLLGEIYGKRAVIGRMGGDEFAIYSIYEGLEEDKIREKVSLSLDYIMDRIGESFDKKKITISVGVRIAEGKHGFEELYKTADSALYKSKNSGKSRYTFWREGDTDEEKND